jgi:hypothetical protein
MPGERVKTEEPVVSVIELFVVVAVVATTVDPWIGVAVALKTRTVRLSFCPPEGKIRMLALAVPEFPFAPVALTAIVKRPVVE